MTSTRKLSESANKDGNVLERCKGAIHPNRIIKSKGPKLNIIHFKDFPQLVFDIVCKNISVKDVLSLSQTCKTIQKKVEFKIYKKMKIEDIDHIEDEDELEIQRHFGFFKDESLENESWWVSNDVSSIRSPRKLLYFIYNIISNPVHGKYLKAIEISPVLKPSPWQRRNDDESNMNNSIWHKTLDNFLSSGELEYIQKKFLFFDSSLTLFDCLKKLLQYTPNLERLILSRFSLALTLDLITRTSNLKELKIMVYEHDVFVDVPFDNLTKLEKLRIKFQENTEPFLEKISSKLLDCNVLQKLKSLQLRYDKTDFNHQSNITWFSFFKPLINNGLVFEQLNYLELKDCFFDTFQKDLIDKLSIIIPFEQLEGISLQIYEYSHPDMKNSSYICDSYKNHENTALSYISSKLKNIREVKIKPTKNCKNCQINSVLYFLRSHPQLRNIWLSTDSLNKENYNQLINTLHAFRNLDQLAFFDEFSNKKLTSDLKNWFIIQNKVYSFDIFKNYESEYLRQDLSPLFDCYIIDEFKSFNERELDLLVLFWRKALAEYGLENLLRTENCGATQVKLFGYNFKVDRIRRVFMLYISKDFGYVDLYFY
ncbi:hypothetical protein CANINC_000126 [Pichia inconspicua]|uniref:F-box domain-containing protein n=1 Tax=Pichia inconspicua TaxID=52247 RepID=A0A4T0X7B8_9ASCO|nr:hypothetical protein CANINC_000126 [[Candida] inconspicua]